MPISVPEFKQHARIDGDDQDIAIEQYILAAADYVESYQHRCWRLSTWQALYDAFPCEGVFYVPRPPLVSVVSLEYLDQAGDVQTLDPSVYAVDVISEPGRVALAYSQHWPETIQQINAVTLTFQAGHASADNIPPRVKQAIRLIAAASYEHREYVTEGSISTMRSVFDLLDQDRFVSYR